jgi:hypothetical protein
MRLYEVIGLNLNNQNRRNRILHVQNLTVKRKKKCKRWENTGIDPKEWKIGIHQKKFAARSSFGGNAASSAPGGESRNHGANECAGTGFGHRGFGADRRGPVARLEFGTPELTDYRKVGTRKLFISCFLLFINIKSSREVLVKYCKSRRSSS